jgi:hypothetical protein
VLEAGWQPAKLQASGLRYGMVRFGLRHENGVK